MLQEQMTVRGEKGGKWEIYPRPQMVRDSFWNLNGEWEFGAGNQMVFDRKIQVPFCPECALSGVKTHFDEGQTLWYKRTVRVQKGDLRGRMLLHFGAVDQIADVYVNGWL